jgi:SAM-dependent methyltransferase
MIESRVQCPACGKRIDYRYHTYWMCGFCGKKYRCVQGVPKLYLEESLGKADKDLRDRLYNTLLGRIYNFLQPFLTIPVRPVRISRMYWLVYFLLIIILGFLVYHCGEWVALRRLHRTTLVDLLLSFLLVTYVLFLLKYPFIANLLLLAVPVKISLSLHRFKPVTSHASVHAEFQEEYLRSTDRLHVLDVATGSCNSLFRHGWMKLNAEYTGVDLSETMLIQGMHFMSANEVPVDFILCDATRLPFDSETFDIVTSYGAVNAYADPKRALEEMVRVTKKGGKILFLDEQLYQSASWFERAYYKYVLTAHNTIDRCPVDMLPKQLEDTQVHQVYEFLYICTARKRRE